MTETKIKTAGRSGGDRLAGESGENPDFDPQPRMKGRFFSRLRNRKEAPAPVCAPPLPPLGAAMRRLSASDAAHRFGEMIDAAQIEPVIVERHGRARAVIMSVGRFEAYEKLLRERSYALAAESFHQAIGAACDGRLKLSAQLRQEARQLGFFADRRRK